VLFDRISTDFRKVRNGEALIPDQAAKALFFAALMFIIALSASLFGVAVGKFQIWPYGPLDVMYNHVNAFVNAGVWAPEGRVVRAPATAARNRVVMHLAKQFMPGYRAIMGWDRVSQDHAIWLLDDRGNEVHSWRIDQGSLGLDDRPSGGGTPHGMQVLEDGTILVNFDDHTALTRLDPCGDPIWIRKDGVYHHAIGRDDDGSFWTWRGDRNKTDVQQYLVKFDAHTGKTLTEFSLVDDFLTTATARTVFGQTTDFDYSKRSGDIFHPNDVEPLPSSLADRFPGFRAGDLLVSIRTPNLVAILDPVSMSLKWWSHGPWSYQHDPDFESDGRIWVFDNNRALNQSRIVSIDPKTRRADAAPSRPSSRFYSSTMGTHQVLPNKTRLIVVPDEGRVLEISRSGALVFEFNNVLNENFNAHVQNAQWLPADFFDSVPSCVRE
jgi:hypothetical protein